MHPFHKRPVFESKMEKMTPLMKPSLLGWSCLFLSFFVLTNAQSIAPIQTGLVTDSSYYDVAQVGVGEFWVAGENGILKRVDEEGNVTNIALPFAPVNILKIVANEQYVYLGADQGMIIRYDKQAGTFKRSYYTQKFQKRCFYDMLLLEDGSLMVAGGHQKIAKAGKTLPHGFIAKADADLNFDPEIVWSNALQFAWSLLAPEEGGKEYLASIYGGIQTTIFSSINEGETWQRKAHLPVLIHELRWEAGKVAYSGSKNFFFTRNGITGTLGGNQRVWAEEGCIWTSMTVGEHQLSLANNGSIVISHKVSGMRKKTLRPAATALYEAVPLGGEKVLVVGHGRQMFVIDLAEEILEKSDISRLESTK